MLKSIIQKQKVNHCGPASLTSALGVFGVEVTQSEVTKKSGHTYIGVVISGVDEDELSDTARKFGARVRWLRNNDEDEGPLFLRRLNRHLRSNKPAILAIDDSTHWVVVLARIKGVYIVMDPIEKPQLRQWTPAYLLQRAWCDDDEEYFTMLIGHNKKSELKLGEDFRKHVKTGVSRPLQACMKFFGD